MSEVRVRFAPSPTGEPHVGNIRTALFNWVFARHYGGKFVLRIEDTDRQRYQEGALQAILNGLKWVGLEWDEGPLVGGPYAPYFQSERLEFYKKYAKKLVENGNAYWCQCSPERLEMIRKEQQLKKEAPKYDRHCRERGLDSVVNGSSCVLRFKTPLSGKTIFFDKIRGEVSFDNSVLDDFVILKSDGYPTYHLANVLDDNLMKISHVMRAEEWISSTPKHLLLYKAFGFKPPNFAHLSIILGPDRTRLSKRHGATSIAQYEEKGFLPEAVFNFLTLLGWSPGDDREIMTKEEIIQTFSLEGINPSPAVFDVKKLEWMNGEYIRKSESKRLLELILNKKPSIMKEENDKRVLKLVEILKERCKTINDFLEQGNFFFEEDIVYDNNAVKKQFEKIGVSENLGKLLERWRSLEEFDKENLEKSLRDLSAELGIMAGEIIHPTRVALTGVSVGAGLFELAEVLGREKVIERLEKAIQYIKKKI